MEAILVTAGLLKNDNLCALSDDGYTWRDIGDIGQLQFILSK